MVETVTAEALPPSEASNVADVTFMRIFWFRNCTSWRSQRGVSKRRERVSRQKKTQKNDIVTSESAMNQDDGETSGIDLNMIAKRDAGHDCRLYSKPRSKSQSAYQSKDEHAWKRDNFINAMLD